jgi:ABC-type bacteriocin/lantibiotic exporter with double-glycine peptidase domain
VRRRRIPLVRQATSFDCGAASLTMVLAWHGRHLRLEEVRDVTGHGRDGATANGILRAGQWFGLRGRAVKVETIEDLDLLPAGAILHWKFQHFVVFERRTSRAVEIVDPAAGRRRVPLEQAGRQFTGVALLFEPGADFIKENRGPRTAWSYLIRLREQWPLVARIFAVSAILQLLALAVPFLVGFIVDRVVPGNDVRLLQILAAGLAGLAGFQLLSSLVRGHLLVHLRTSLDSQLTLDFLDHLVELPYSFFQNRSGGDVLTRLNSNSTIRESVTAGALTALLDGGLVVLYLVLLLRASSPLGLLVLALGVIRVIIFLLTHKRLRTLVTDLIERQADSQGYQIQILAGMETLKASGAEKRAVEHWSNLYAEVLNVSAARGRLSAWVDSMLEALAVVSPLSVLLYGALLVLRGELSLGTMLAANALAAGFLGPLSKLVSTALDLQLLGSYLERVNEVMETPREQDPERVRRPSRLQGRIELEGVGFRYGPSAPWVVRDVSLEVRPGQFVALVGRSGAGKSTLAHLLVGLHRPSEGRILFDGIDLADLDLRGVRSQLGVVPQRPFLFGTSIRANIAINTPELPLSRVVEAARKACIHDEIMAMPMAYDTLLAEGGASLSGGQRQRLALARALIHRPALLLLDEATSSLDSVTEAEVHRELSALDGTRIVIAHRLSTIRDADLILVMHEGRIAEQGTHGMLVAQGGIYKDLVSRQELAGATMAPDSREVH